MHALIVLSHPGPESLTHTLAAALAQGVQASGHHAQMADLAAEGFDACFSRADHLAFTQGSTPPPHILAEQQRIERADAMALVFPVYWWSFPALMKGWLDRVLTNGWAYGTDAQGQPADKLAGLPVHLLPLAWSSARTYARRGYRQAMRVQIDHGIFDYVNARVVCSDLFHLDDGAEALLERARCMGQQLFA